MRESNRTTVVITTINGPTPEVDSWFYGGFHSVTVVLDERTPLKPWQEYASRQRDTDTVLQLLTCEKQGELWPDWCTWAHRSHYSRKSVGYMWAISQGLDVLETDDDNALANISPEEHEVELLSGARWWNPYEDSYARGLPCPWWRYEEHVASSTVDWHHDTFMVMHLIDGEGDLCATCRAVNAPDLRRQSFQQRTFQMAPGTWTPINSQATWMPVESAMTMWMPSHCPGRVSDIARGYVQLRRSWALGKPLYVGAPICSQTRNVHCIATDLFEEHRLLKHSRHVPDALKHATEPADMYHRLCSLGMLDVECLESYGSWCEAVTKNVNKEINLW